MRQQPKYDRHARRDDWMVWKMSNMGDKVNNYYHGTHLYNGLRIGRKGFILSPWYLAIDELKSKGLEDKQKLSKILAANGMSADMPLEGLALELASLIERRRLNEHLETAKGDEAAVSLLMKNYEEEIKTRIKSVSFSKFLSRAASYT